jgi:hypothetical protein
MKGKRRWESMPKRIASELNGVSGITGVGETAMSIAGLTILAGPESVRFLLHSNEVPNDNVRFMAILRQTASTKAN